MFQLNKHAKNEKTQPFLKLFYIILYFFLDKFRSGAGIFKSSGKENC